MEKVKDVWVLTIRTNVPINGIYERKDYICAEEPDTLIKEKPVIQLYSTFNKAKKEMLSAIRMFGRSENNLFDGKGNIIGFSEYFENRKDFYENQNEYDSHVLDEEDFKKVSDLPCQLRKWLMSDDNEKTIVPEDIWWTDWMLLCIACPEHIAVTGVDDGPCNGVNPYIFINTFKMNDPAKEYRFHVENSFEERFMINEPYCYIDLRKVTTEG